MKIILTLALTLFWAIFPAYSVGMNKVSEGSGVTGEFTACISTFINHHSAKDLSKGEPIRTSNNRMLRIPPGWQIVGSSGDQNITTILLCR